MKKKAALIITVFILLLLLAFGFFRSRPRKPSFVVSVDSVTASKDQKRLINNFGYPDTFALAMEKKERLEVWKYYGLERSFTFKNGVFVSDQIIDPLESFNAYPRLRPTQFKAGLTLKQTSKVIDSEPTSRADIVPEIMNDATVFSYSDQVMVGVRDGKVVFVQTLPVKTE